MKEHKINKNNNFINGWYIDLSICDDLINYFEKSDRKEFGKCGGEVNLNKKKSIDLGLNTNLTEPCIQKYLAQLKLVIDKYKSVYEYADKNQYFWNINDNFNIQKYEPNGGFYEWHTERNHPHNSLRHLTFMTYLNDVHDKGETEWFYQKVKVKPEKGLTVIWCTDWTFTHRGVPSPTENKYIITGWYSYINNI
jgi:hypothetical protein